MRKPEKQPAWIDLFILVGAGFFIFALFLSAVFDERIRVLHALQALIYVSVIVLTRRQSDWGYGAGFFIAALWNYTNLFVNTFFQAGMRQLVILLQTGRLERPDLLISVVAVSGHFLMIIACLAGFLRGRRNWWQFVGGGITAVIYFVAIIYLTGSQYIGLLKRVFHW